MNSILPASSKINHLAKPNNAKWAFACILLAISAFGFLAPWSVTPNAGITLNAYDLAEWMSLSPSVRSESPTLFTPFLLRLGLFFIVIILSRMPISPWIKMSTILVFGVSMLPPLEILSNGQDPNYLQLLIIAIGGSLCALASVTIRLRPHINRLVLVAICGLAVLTASVAIMRAVQVFSELQIVAMVGLGYGMYILGIVGTALGSILSRITKTG